MPSPSRGEVLEAMPPRKASREVARARTKTDSIGADACPVPEGHEERLAFGRSFESKPR